MITKTDYERECYGLEDLMDIVKILRAPGGCPWDAEQTHKSTRKDLLEEAYEVADAIDNDDNIGLCEELGDLLLQVFFHTEISNENNEFNIDNVTDGICRKLILRHPHVFGNVKADTSEEVLNNWDAIKRQEKSQKTYTDTLVSVPRAFPSLMRAAKVQKRAGKSGFDWDNIEDSFPKIAEETEELKNALGKCNQSEIEEELGDLLFAVVNVSRFCHVDAEKALSDATDKFIGRFKSVEQEVLKSNKDMKDMSLAELNDLWNKVKKEKK